MLSVRPVEPTEIKAGGTALVVSKAQSDGKERRLVEADAIVDPPGSGPGPQPGSTMTSGKLANVVKTDAGLEFDVAYPGGERNLLLPSGARVIDTYSVGQGALKVGTSVHSQLIREADGTVSTGAVMVMPPGAGPPR